MRTHGFHFRPQGAVGWLAAGAGIVATGYGTYARISWSRFGKVKSTVPDELLDRFMPDYDVVDSHHIRVAAPAEITLAAASSMDLLQSPLIRCIFKVREFTMGTKAQPEMREKALIEQVKSLGWKVLAQNQGREIVFGAVTQPWLADVVFRPLEADEFASFREPGYVKIAWTLRADPMGSDWSVFCMQTRAKATDPIARQRFRRYWSLVSAGIVLIRWISLRLTKKEAEHLAQRAKRAA
jgi:hypothetical protein